MKEMENIRNKPAQVIFDANEQDLSSAHARYVNVKPQYFGTEIKKVAGVKQNNISLFSGNKEEKIIDDDDIVGYKIEQAHQKATLQVAHKMPDGSYKYFQISGEKVESNSEEGATFQIGKSQEKFQIKDITLWQEANVVITQQGQDTEGCQITPGNKQITIIKNADAKESLAGITSLIGSIRENKDFRRIGQIKSFKTKLFILIGCPEAALFNSIGLIIKSILKQLLDPEHAIWDKIAVKTDASGKALTDENGAQITEIVEIAVPARIFKHLFAVGAVVGAMAITATIFSSSLAIVPVSWLIVIIVAVVVFPGVTKSLYRTGIIPGIALIVLSGGNPIMIGAVIFVIVGAIVFPLLYSYALNKSGQWFLEGKTKRAVGMLFVALLFMIPGAAANGFIGTLSSTPTYYNRIDVMDSLNKTSHPVLFAVLVLLFKIVPSVIKNAPKVFLIVLAVALLPLLAAPSGLAFVVLAPQQSWPIYLALKVFSFSGTILGPFFGAQLSAGSLIHLIMSSSLPLSTIYAFAGLATVWVSWPIVFAIFRFFKGLVDIAQGRIFRSSTLYQTMNIADLKNPTISDYLHAIVEGSLKNNVGFFIEKLGKLIVKSLVLDKLDKLSDSEEMNEILNAENEVIEDLDAKNAADFEWAASMYKKILQSETYVDGMEQTAANLRKYLSMVNPDLCLQIINEVFKENLNKNVALKQLFDHEKYKATQTVCKEDGIVKENSTHLEKLAIELNTAIGQYWDANTEEDQDKYKKNIEIIAEYFYGLGKIAIFKEYLKDFNELHKTKQIKKHVPTNRIYKKQSEISVAKLSEYINAIEAKGDRKPALEIKTEGKNSCLLVKNSRYNNDKLKSAMAGLRTWLNKPSYLLVKNPPYNNDKSKPLMERFQAWRKALWEKLWKNKFTTAKQCLMHVESGKPVSFRQKLTSLTWWRTGHVKFKPKEMEKLYEQEHEKNISIIVHKAELAAINSIFIDQTNVTKPAGDVLFEKIYQNLFNRLSDELKSHNRSQIIEYMKNLISQLSIDDLKKPWNQLKGSEKKVIFETIKSFAQNINKPNLKILAQCILEELLTIETNEILLKEGKSAFKKQENITTEVNEESVQAFYKLYEGCSDVESYKNQTKNIIQKQLGQEIIKIAKEIELTKEVYQNTNDDYLKQIEALKNQNYKFHEANLDDNGKHQNNAIIAEPQKADDKTTEIKQLLKNNKEQYDKSLKDLENKQDIINKYSNHLDATIRLLFEKHTAAIDANKLIAPALLEGVRTEMLEDDMANNGSNAEQVKLKKEFHNNAQEILGNYWKRALEETRTSMKSQLSFDEHEMIEKKPELFQNSDISNEAAEMVLQKTTYVKSQEIKKKEEEIFNQALNDAVFDQTIKQYKNNLDLDNNLLYKDQGQAKKRHAAQQYYKGDDKKVPYTETQIDPAIDKLALAVNQETSNKEIKKTINSTTKDIQAELQLSSKGSEATEYPKTGGWTTKFSEYYWPRFTRFIRPPGTRLATLGRSLVNIFRTTNHAQYPQSGSSPITSAASVDKKGATAKLSREFGPGTQENNERYLEKQLALQKFREKYTIMYEESRKAQNQLVKKIADESTGLQPLDQSEKGNRLLS